MGTQAAVWKLTNRVSLGAWRAGAGLGAENEYAVVKKVYDYLTRVEVVAAEPKRTVTFTEGSYNEAPDLFVSGPASALKVEVENGYAITDSRYTGGVTYLITEVVNGGGFFVRSTRPGGIAEVTVTAEHAVTPGQAFRAEGVPPLTPARPYGDPVTGTIEKQFPAYGQGGAPQPSPPPGTTPTATPTAAPATPPTPSPTGGAGGGLPVTGTPTGVVLGGGLLLLTAGAAAVLLVRRRLRFTS